MSYDPAQLREMVRQYDPRSEAGPTAELYWLEPAFVDGVVAATKERLDLLPEADGTYRSELLERVATVLQAPVNRKQTLGERAVVLLDVINGLAEPPTKRRQSKEWGPDDPKPDQVGEPG